MPSFIYPATADLKRALREHTLQTDDNTEIYYQYAKQPDNAELIIFIHGYSEHSDCYLSIMSWFFQRGYHVASFDVRGHGLSGGERGFISHFKTYSSDLHQVITAIKQQCQPRKMNLLAHSNGGLLTCYYLLTHEKAHHPQRLILSAPYLGTHPNALPIKPIQWLLIQATKLYPMLSLPKKVKPFHLTHDESILKKMAADKKRLNATSIAWFLAAQDAQESVFKCAKHWPRIPTLMIIAENDELADNQKIKQFFDTIESPGKLIIAPQDAYHEILNELDRETTYQNIHDWLMNTPSAD